MMMLWSESPWSVSASAVSLSSASSSAASDCDCVSAIGAFGVSTSADSPPVVLGEGAFSSVDAVEPSSSISSATAVDILSATGFGCSPVTGAGSSVVEVVVVMVVVVVDVVVVVEDDNEPISDFGSASRTMGSASESRSWVTCLYES